MAKKTLAFVGTYTRPLQSETGDYLSTKGKGIYCFELDREKGELYWQNENTDIDNPSYLTLDRTGRYLYAVNELPFFDGKPQGAISAFAVSPEDHRLTFLNRQGSGGPGPCHIVLNDANTHCYVSNYGGGSVCVFPLGGDGRLGPASEFIQHTDQGAHSGDSAIPHAHSLLFDRDNRYAFVLDLGLDKVMAYVPDFKRGTLALGQIPWYAALAGSGPRHGVFSKDGGFCYVIHEITSTISVLAYEREKGVFTHLETQPAVVDDAFAAWTASADIHLHPNGAFLYASNRGHDSIVIYGVDKNTGKLSYVNNTPCGGKTPRSFAIDSSGTYMLVANQDSDNIVVFAIDPVRGILRKVSEAAVPTPACVRLCEV